MELVQTTKETCSTPMLIWAIASACWVLASEICCIKSLDYLVLSIISWRDLSVGLATRVPFSTAWSEFLISSDVSFALYADLVARFRTSSATTSNPLPAAPALADSTVAFNAKILFWQIKESTVLAQCPDF